MSKLHFPSIIIGGGVAGLWLFHRLHKQGHQAILLEKDTLGGQQSIQSQGIIHGGIKYALNGILTPSANAIAGMPERWGNAMADGLEVDLTSVEPLSQYHYMWTGNKLGSKITTFFASKAVRGRMQKLPQGEVPEPFKLPNYNGEVYALNEWVVPLEDTLKALVSPFKDYAFQANTIELTQENDLVEVRCGDQIMTTPNLILTAGEGNQALIKDMTGSSFSWPEMQIRPLHMIMAKGPLPEIYGHCIGNSSKPLFTITSTRADDGEVVWSIGGDLAENGLNDSEANQVSNAQKAITKQLPWLDFSQVKWRSWHINRAEPAQQSLVRPDTAFAFKENNLTLCWPTKLALAPDLSDQILKLGNFNAEECTELPQLPQAQLTLPFWKTLFQEAK